MNIAVETSCSSVDLAAGGTATCRSGTSDEVLGGAVSGTELPGHILPDNMTLNQIRTINHAAAMITPIGGAGNRTVNLTLRNTALVGGGGIAANGHTNTLGIAEMLPSGTSVLQSQPPLLASFSRQMSSDTLSVRKSETTQVLTLPVVKQSANGMAELPSEAPSSPAPLSVSRLISSSQFADLPSHEDQSDRRIDQRGTSATDPAVVPSVACSDTDSCISSLSEYTTVNTLRGDTLRAGTLRGNTSRNFPPVSERDAGTAAASSLQPSGDSDLPDEIVRVAQRLALVGESAALYKQLTPPEASPSEMVPKTHLLEHIERLGQLSTCHLAPRRLLDPSSSSTRAGAAGNDATGNGRTGGLHAVLQIFAEKLLDDQCGMPKTGLPCTRPQPTHKAFTARVPAIATC